MFRLFMRMGGWFAFLPLAAALVAAIFWWLERSDAARLDAEGRTVTATITRLWTTTTHGRRTTTTHYHAAFSYAEGSALANAPRIARGEEEVSSAFWVRLDPGAQVPFRYVPGAGITELEPGAHAGSARTAGWIGLVLGLIGLVVGWLIWRVAARGIRLRDRGSVAVGTPERVVVKKGATLHFVFQDEEGRVQRGRSLGRGPKFFDGMTRGTPLTIYYDPARPSGAWWEGDTGPRKAPAAPAREMAGGVVR